MILGTAGHIDHGKTALIKALTGVDTDRLPEEKRRGITIELGFAPLVLDGVGVIGVVDVPGHEAFVRTMVAGASGVDLALLVVAADEGVMPQTREHLAILSLLGIRAGLVVLTKRDLVDDEWLALVTDDVRTFLTGSPLEGASIVPASAATGDGLEDVRDVIRHLALVVPPRERNDLFRLPVDRSFSVRGTGTVVTGTVWSGRLSRDDTVLIPPNGHARVRGIQVHGAAVDEAGPGTRAAIALAGVDVSDVPRGSMLVAGSGWQSTRLLRADVTLLADAKVPLGARTRVRFHLGTTDVDARVVALGGPLQPGERRGVRIVLDEPVVARTGDRFVIRRASPLATIGGGVVTDPLPPHRRVRPWPASAGRTLSDALRLMLAEADAQGVLVAALPIRLGVPVSSVTAMLAAERDLVIELGGRAYAAHVLETLSARLRETLAESHLRFPLETGTSLQAVRSRLAASPELVDEVVRRGIRAGDVELEGGIIRASGWAPRLTPEQTALAERLADAHAKARSEPPSVTELQELHGDSVPHLLRFLERDGRLVQVEAERYYDPVTVTRLVDSLRTGMQRNREYSPAELRELLGVSRKYLIPFLEFCDRRGVTERRPSGRVLHGT